MSDGDSRDRTIGADDAGEVDAAIEAYRFELCTEAELATGDLDEIEDHLRELIGELRAAGRGAPRSQHRCRHFDARRWASVRTSPRRPDRRRCARSGPAARPG